MRKHVARSTKKYRAKHPGEPLKLWYIPYTFIHHTLYVDNYDVEFAETFYTGLWIEGINQEEILANIKCPSTYIKTSTLYGKDGVLYAANSDKDAEKVNNLIEGNDMITIKSGHDIHFEKPDKFIQIMIDFLDKHNKFA
ncbi:alpha/beta fold hydrolase [Wukongibacter sp. M2B1]|uniref:alpha/beta fold hydrolase n=1 Tax=Wukongibacter sp. M2B1 TaxID=3088895 RepID=UPI003D79AC4F